ncbi:MAG TPA: HAMP domain-containing protein, partial [Firmicutes bacterium]|nr:HAMP domain-containing protein [Bacillota bacterium]
IAAGNEERERVERKIIDCASFDRIQAAAIFTEEYNPVRVRREQVLDEFVSLQERKIEEAVEKAEAASDALQMAATVLTGASAALAVILAMAASRKIAVPIVQLTADVKRVAEGDLTVETRVKSRDEIGDLADAFNRTVGSLSVLVSDAVSSSEIVASASLQLSSSMQESAEAMQQISDTVQQMATAALQGSDSAEQSAAAAEQLSMAIGQVAAGAESQTTSVHEASVMLGDMGTALAKSANGLENVSSATESTKEAAAEGSAAVNSMVTSVESARVEAARVSDAARELDESSREIGRIVEVISDIADQTNLLALNAAIEAARAGEHGRGFAVVADEVRKLAERSLAETKAIAGLVEGLRDSTGRVVTAIEVSNAATAEAAENASGATGLLEKILANANETATYVQELAAHGNDLITASARLQKAVEEIVMVADGNAAAAEEMEAGVGEVKASIDSVAAVSQENAAAVDEVSAAASEVRASIESVAESADALAKMARNLREAVSKFKVG